MIEYKSPRRVTASWLVARDLCLEEGGTLADMHVNNMEAVEALPNHSEFWVGLYRNTSWTWHTGTENTVGRVDCVGFLSCVLHLGHIIEISPH